MNPDTLPTTSAPVGVTRDALQTLAGIHGLAALTRDDQLRVRWCDDAFAHLNEMERDAVIGTTLHDLMPAPAANEREGLIREVLDTGTPATIVQFGADKRLVCRVMPIDEASFGYRGVLCLMREGELGGVEDSWSAPSDTTPRVLRTPCLDDLAALTNAELRTLYDLACGASNSETADRQFRSVRTIENHVESIHKKLGTTTRSALVRFATERGVHGFSPDEWDRIVDGASETRRARVRPVKKKSLSERRAASEI